MYSGGRQGVNDLLWGSESEDFCGLARERWPPGDRAAGCHGVANLLLREGAQDGEVPQPPQLLPPVIYWPDADEDEGPSSESASTTAAATSTSMPAKFVTASRFAAAPGTAIR